MCSKRKVVLRETTASLLYQRNSKHRFMVPSASLSISLDLRLSDLAVSFNRSPSLFLSPLFVSREVKHTEKPQGYREKELQRGIRRMEGKTMRSSVVRGQRAAVRYTAGIFMVFKLLLCGLFSWKNEKLLFS